MPQAPLSFIAESVLLIKQRTLFPLHIQRNLKPYNHILSQNIFVLSSVKRNRHLSYESILPARFKPLKQFMIFPTFPPHHSPASKLSTIISNRYSTHFSTGTLPPTHLYMLRTIGFVSNNYTVYCKK